MDISIEAIIFYLLLIDSIGANIVIWLGLGDQWYYKNLRTFSRYFPLSKGWALYYLVLILWVGFTLWRLGVLPY